MTPRSPWAEAVAAKPSARISTARITGMRRVRNIAPPDHTALFQRRPVDAAGTRVGAHRPAARDLERLEIDCDDAVVIAQSEVGARAVRHHEDAAVAGIAIGDLHR